MARMKVLLFFFDKRMAQSERKSLRFGNQKRLEHNVYMEQHLFEVFSSSLHCLHLRRELNIFLSIYALYLMSSFVKYKMLQIYKNEYTHTIFIFIYLFILVYQYC